MFDAGVCSLCSRALLVLGLVGVGRLWHETRLFWACIAYFEWSIFLGGAFGGWFAVLSSLGCLGVVAWASGLEGL